MQDVPEVLAEFGSVLTGRREAVDISEAETVGTPSASPSADHIDALRQEHEELTQLFIHEDSMAWQLNLTFLATNGAIFAGAFSLGLLDPGKIPGLEAYLLLLVGVVLNISMYFVFQRSELHRLSRLSRAYQVEDQLQQCGILIKTFSSAERLIADKKALEGSTTRALRWHETKEVLDWNWWPLLLAALCTVGVLWLLSGRPGISGLPTDRGLPPNIGIHPTAAVVRQVPPKVTPDA